MKRTSSTRSSFARGLFARIESRRTARPSEGSRETAWLTRIAAGLVIAGLGAGVQLGAQPTLTPTSINIVEGAVCTAGSQDIPVSITLPPAAVIDDVDVFFLFDDTGSFASFVPTVTGIFGGLVTSLETSLPGVNFGFGVGRFEDYGGPGATFSSEVESGRPFTLNQPIVTAADAGGSVARDALIATALANTAPGFGGDGPETTLEALYQTATGFGFDGDGNGSTLDSGNAGDIGTQLSPGTSGDVPPFSSNTLPTSGTLGGAGWRPGALHLVILATDVCSVTAFPAGVPAPLNVLGAGVSVEPATAFACTGVTPGENRFGFVSDAKTFGANTVAGAIAPSDAAGLEATISALNALGIRVIGMGPSAAPTTAPGPAFEPDVLLSALARLTGAVDAAANPLVFDTAVALPDLSAAIAGAIETTTTLPVDVSLSAPSLPPGLSFSFSPPVVPGVSPGGTAEFVVTLTGDGSAINGSFDINFIDFGSNAVLGAIPTTVSCGSAPACGNGVIDAGEECDDGNAQGGDGCSDACAIEEPEPACGDGVLDGDLGEECDDGNTQEGDGCSSDCGIEEPVSVCGDGVVDEGEECDDGNTRSRDGCSATCDAEAKCVDHHHGRRGHHWGDRCSCDRHDLPKLRRIFKKFGKLGKFKRRIPFHKFVPRRGGR